MSKYTYGSWEEVGELYNSEWYKLGAVLVLARTLARVDFSVVASRREGHEALNTFRNDSSPIPFADDKRFPQSFASMYLCTHDPGFAGVLVELASVLSYREDNGAKDTKSVTDAKMPGSRGDKDVVLAFDQGKQDNVKRFEELVKSLGKMCNNRDLIWTQKTFEARTDSTWA